MWPNVAVFISFLACFFIQGAKKIPECCVEIHGHVYDSQGRPLKGAQIVLSNGQRTISTQTDELGSYVASLYPGNSKFKIVSSGYCPLSEELSATSVGTNGTLDFVLVDCSDCPEMDIDFAPMKIDTDGSAPTNVSSRSFVFKYEVQDLAGQQFGKFEAKIYFGRKTDEANHTVYEGLDCPGHLKNPVFVYYGGTLSAHKLIVSGPDNLVIAEGNILLSDELGVRRGQSARVSFSLTKPTAYIEK
jgi:hypothetical protein